MQVRKSFKGIITVTETLIKSISEVIVEYISVVKPIPWIIVIAE